MQEPTLAPLGMVKSTIFCDFHDFWNDDNKKVGIWPRECVFRNQRGRFSPYGSRIRELWKKDGFSMKKMKMMKKSPLGVHAMVDGRVLSNGMCPGGRVGMWIRGYVYPGGGDG